jgi:hypothetical protein
VLFEYFVVISSFDNVPAQSGKRRASVRCARCGNTMRLVAVLDHDETVLYGHALDYLDSG